MYSEGCYWVVKLIVIDFSFLLHECLLSVNLVLILWHNCFVKLHSTVDKLKYFLTGELKGFIGSASRELQISSLEALPIKWRTHNMYINSLWCSIAIEKNTKNKKCGLNKWHCSNLKMFIYRHRQNRFLVF